MRVRSAWLFVWIVAVGGCRSEGPRATGGAPDAGGVDVAGIDAVVDAGAFDVGGDDAGAVDGLDGPGPSPGARPVKRSPGCGMGTRAEGVRYVDSGGLRMPFTVRLPAGHDPDRASPLGFAFPDATWPQCTVYCWGFTDLDAITVFPRSWTQQWNDTESARQTNNRYFEDLLTFVKNEYCVDENRIFVAGAGRGGEFAQQLACQHGDWLWQVSPVSATAPLVDGACRGRPAALVVHSVEEDGAAAGQAVVQNLAARNGCAAAPPPGLATARDEMLAAYRANRPDARCLDWAGCASPVRLCLVSNRVNSTTDTTQGYRGWPMSGGQLIGAFLEGLE